MLSHDTEMAFGCHTQRTFKRFFVGFENLWSISNVKKSFLMLFMTHLTLTVNRNTVQQTIR